MKKILTPIFILIILFSCNSKKKIPDVSNIKINLEVSRFERDFFGMDTVRIAESIKKISEKYPQFTHDFVYNILGLDLDSLLVPGNQQQTGIRLFIHDYMPIKDSADVLFGNFTKQADEIKKGLQFVKYYFPSYKVPTSVITFIGPVNANFQTSFGTQGDILTGYALGVGLQLHLGKNFSLYKSPEGQELYPDYISDNFDEEHISVNCMKNIVDDIYPDKSIGKALIDQMVEKGKRMFMLTRFLPSVPENICLNYSREQMKNVHENEAVIWDFFLSNDLLNNAEQNITKNYIGESPKTQELGEGAPGNLGTYCGLQIVKKYMDKYPETTMADLLKTDPRKIYNLSRYKPKA